MYKWLVENTDYIIRAEKSGIITDILKDAVEVLYDDKSKEVIELQRSSLKTGNIIVMEIRKAVGERFREGDIIADSLISKDGFFSPGVNLFVAYMPYYGYNNEDGLVISEKASEKFTSLTYNSLKLTLGDYNKNNWRFKKYVSKGEFVNENQDILCVTSKLPKTKPKYLNAAYGKTGILQSIGRQINSKDDTVTYKANIISFDEMLRGDKMSGRHGNKGTISLIEKNSKIPSFLNGELLDIIINPCGVPSRMNLGQMLEAHLGFVCCLLDLHIRSDSFNGAAESEIKELLRFCYDLSNAEKADSVINNKTYKHLPDVIKDAAYRRFEYIKTWRGCFEPDGTAYLINNRNGKKFGNRVVIGCAYFMKLAHEVEHKRTERSGVFEGTTYAAVSKQPMRGVKRKGGQTIGEMEIWALIAHGANNFLLEALHDKSDNVYIKNAMKHAVKNKTEYEKRIDYGMFSNHGTEVLKYIIEGMNGYLDTNIGSDVSLESILSECNMIDNDTVDMNDFNSVEESDE